MQDEAAKLFCVSDFIGDMCKAIGSRIRGAVSSVSFDDFHKNSARIIKVHKENKNNLLDNKG